MLKYRIILIGARPSAQPPGFSRFEHFLSRDGAWFLWITCVVILYHILSIFKFTTVCIVLSKVFIDTFPFNSVFQLVSDSLRVEYIFNSPFLLILNNDWVGRRVFLTRQRIGVCRAEQARMEDVVDLHSGG